MEEQLRSKPMSWYSIRLNPNRPSSS